MALDEAMLEEHISGAVPPTLRLYLFAPPAVTIGLSQKLPEETAERIRARGIDVVRRPTGGRAVLHLDDLTYSFVCSDTSAGGQFSPNITESYKQICQGLLHAFKLLGVDSELGTAGSAYRHLQDCFMATTGCDLHHRGTKLIGSAQTRRRGAILQHGSVPLHQDPHLMPELLGEQPPTNRHHNLFELIGRAVPLPELAAAFRLGFEQAFSVTFTDGQLTENEWRRARELANPACRTRELANPAAARAN
jgi:lipoate-protein ligase A